MIRPPFPGLDNFGRRTGEKLFSVEITLRITIKNRNGNRSISIGFRI
jgi:hypothetical protein